MPRIICNDGYIRSFYPAQGIGSHLKISLAYISEAYCEECKTKFRIVSTEEQKKQWKEHKCATTRLKKHRPNDKD